MKQKHSIIIAAGLAAILTPSGFSHAGKPAPAPPAFNNELVDYEGFAKAVGEAGEARKTRRVTEEKFIELAADPATIVLDTRSAAKFALLHVKGAKHLNFSEITKDTLAQLIPSKDTRIVIYCNNNFVKAPVAFPSKRPAMALNIPTFVTLHSYGYRNIYELGPLLDATKTRIQLAGRQLTSN